MAIPTGLPQWDETEVNAVEPDTDHKQEGWLAPGGIPEKPPFETFNYWMNNAYKWIKYFTEEARRLWQNQKVTHNITVDTDYSLTADQNTYGKVIITDSGVILTTGRNIIVDISERSFIFQNDTAQILTVKTSAGTGIAVDPTKKVWLVCDGTNVIDAVDVTGLEIATTVQAQAGTDDTTAMSPLKVHETMLGSDSQQTWTNVTGSRSAGVTYTNTTGRPIEVALYAGAGISNITVDGVIIGQMTAVNANSFSFIVPNNSTYSVGTAPTTWSELR